MASFYSSLVLSLNFRLSLSWKRGAIAVVVGGGGGGGGGEGGGGGGGYIIAILEGQ